LIPPFSSTFPGRITGEGFAHLLKEAGDHDFRETLRFLRHTTASPGEVRRPSGP
jgi:hypothetical protein